ncbi:hypothetical protein H131_09583 [Lysinibacillus sphaericus OT4b.31]|uniref:Uncharacterized protein n=1 Tax=Lysinibacillus sphaericus OT4b.31 TaxID=1285586 RepID=R7ZF43_LYSSH|nr:hypothetical protein H131_09583 [Lysinibacillus sphaericus OT4b.31]
MKSLPQCTWRVIWYAQKQYNIKKSAILQIDIDNLLAGLVEEYITNKTTLMGGLICLLLIHTFFIYVPIIITAHTVVDDFCIQ